MGPKVALVAENNQSLTLLIAGGRYTLTLNMHLEIAAKSGASKLRHVVAHSKLSPLVVAKGWPCWKKRVSDPTVIVLSLCFVGGRNSILILLCGKYIHRKF